MRGAYAAGAIIELFQSGVRFDAVWATSSGAASAAYGVAGQAEGINIWRDHLHGRRLVRPLRLLNGRGALDLDYLIDEVFRRRIPLDAARLRASDVPLEVPATDVDSGGVEYFDLRRADPFRVLRAAMSLPGAVVEPVEIDGRRFVDGGVVDQLPIERALSVGVTDATVILTRPASFESRPIGRTALWWATRKFPGLRGTLLRRHEKLGRAMELLRRPPRGVSMRTISPNRPLPVKRWTTRRARLLRGIQRGSEDARAALARPSSSAPFTV